MNTDLTTNGRTWQPTPTNFTGTMRAIPGLSYNLQTEDTAGVVLPAHLPTLEGITARYCRVTKMLPATVVKVDYDALHKEYTVRFDASPNTNARCLGNQPQIVGGFVCDSFTLIMLEGREYMEGIGE